MRLSFPCSWWCYLGGGLAAAVCLSAQEPTRNPQLSIFWVRASSALVLVSQRRVQSPAARCYQQIKIPPDEGVRHCSSLRTAGSSCIALPVSAANCTSTLSFRVLLIERSQHRLTAHQSTSLDTFLVLTTCSVHIVSILSPCCPVSPACHFILSFFPACSFAARAFRPVCRACLDKPSCSQRARCLSGYPAPEVVVPC